MLSFDITDRNIRVVKGTESNGKIRISSAATLNVEESLIVNGHVKDVPNVATLINGVLKRNKLHDKEAIVSISSNLTIFKEMTVVKGKPQELQKTVRQQMQAELNLDDTYAVSYVVVGEADRTEDSAEPAYRILATACPNEIINSYREVFKLLGISLKSVMIGCNCITKVLLADTKIRSKMPLLAVQIDNNFISLNLYEQGQLSFSRFASIDAADYGYSDDYVFEAVNENIFRMLQFHRSRNTGETIENVIFYGDTHEYVRLTDELEKLDLKTSLINVPPQIHGHENLEFSLYANAIGAMFKRNKEVEKINLLEADLGTVVKSKMKNENIGNYALIGCLAGSLLIAGGAYAASLFIDKGVKDDIKATEDYINSPETNAELEHHERLLSLKDVVNAYYAKIHNARDAYLSQPNITGAEYDEAEKILDDLCKEKNIEYNKIINPRYQDGLLSFSVECDAQDKEYAQKLPADYVQKLQESDLFRNAAYAGYKIETRTVEETKESKDYITFDTAASLVPNKSAYQPETKKDEEAK